MINVFSSGGDSKHFPSHGLDACLAAWVAGAKWLRLNLFLTKDGVVVVAPENNLSKFSNGTGEIQNTYWADLENLDAGYTFSPGKDFPWRQVRVPYERTERGRLRNPLLQLKSLVRHLDEGMGLALNIPDLGNAIEIIQVANSVLRRADHVEVMYISDTVEVSKAIQDQADSYIKKGHQMRLQDSFSSMLNKEGLGHVEYIFCKPEGLDIAPPSDMQVVLQTDDLGQIGQDGNVEPTDTLGTCLEILHPRETFSENFEGNQLDEATWMSGISGGFETPGRMIYNADTGRGMVSDNRSVFDTRLFVDNALVIEIDHGDQYASAGVVTRFPISGDFWVEVDWTYTNPERATMMLLGFTNTDVFASHRPSFDENGQVQNPTWQSEHQIFDTHGNPPFVSVEHEEQDGTRIVSNRMDTGFYRWFNNFYHPNIGDGRTTRGRLRLARRDRYYSAYYLDEHNSSWVGVGATENDSMNNRLYIRMGAKHYPKSGAPDPLPENRITFKNFKIFKQGKNV